jgi:predicted kinase
LGVGGATKDNDKKTVGNKKEEKKVTQLFIKRMFEYCEDGQSFVIDNLNIRKKYRDEIVKIIMRDYPSAKITIIYVEPPTVNDLYERRKNDMDKSVIDDMIKRFDFPQLYECHNLILNKQLNNDGDFINYKIAEPYNISRDKGKLVNYL